MGEVLLLPWLYLLLNCAARGHNVRILPGCFWTDQISAPHGDLHQRTVDSTDNEESLTVRLKRFRVPARPENEPTSVPWLFGLLGKQPRRKASGIEGESYEGKGWGRGLRYPNKNIRSASVWAAAEACARATHVESP
ncbi:hypothetical protein KFK09_001455 [Dendrobium nobile]|uniref:Secreted protein n=1 Tax=Dendrobium nobile TaxID=94219 RepID=A0A8T3CAD4_DENNO|nr:hypothetical protein KFK09_001455 [Dendrobium nobile]